MQVNFAPGQTSAELVIREVGNENPYKLSIETIAHVEGNMALLTLISADAECIIEESRDRIINAELDKIRNLCPEIPIMEV